MRARSSGWLLLSLLVLSALVAAELHLEVGKGAGGRALGQDSRPAGTVPVPLFALAQRDSFSETLERPLFMPNRQPLEAEQAAPAAPAPRASRPDADRYTLTAIIIVDDERIALLTDTATGSLNRVREGERVAGWEIEKIRRDSAVLRDGDTRAELSLRNFDAPPPLPPPRSAGKRRVRTGDDASKQAGGNAVEATPNRPRRSGRSLRQSLKLPGTQRN